MTDISHLEITLFGNPIIRRNGQIYNDFKTKKSKALLIYLLYTQVPHHRDYLADLFWGTLSQERASANFRHSLSDLRKDFSECLYITRTEVGIDHNADYRVDTHLVHNYLQQQHPTKDDLDNMLLLYRAPFLDSFHINKTPDFLDWIIIEREKWHNNIVQTLSRQVRQLIEKHSYHDGLHYVEKLVALDPTNEMAQQLKLSLLGWTGQRTEAIRYYHQSETLLNETFNITPDPQTTEIYEQIKAGSFKLTANAIVSSEPQLQKHHIPTQLVPLIGREKEIDQLSVLLTNPQIKLVTIVAMGGMGKTHLSLAVAEQQREHFSDGIYFIEFAHLSVDVDIMQHIALSINYQLHIDADTAMQQLLDYLNDKQMLVILDNFEHLQSQNKLILRLLNSTRYLTLLVTSRLRLNIRGEHIFNLKVFETVDWQSIDEANKYPAVQLFVSNARRIQPEFTLTEVNLGYVSRICSIVDGLPLGLLMASSWLSVLTPQQIVDRISQSLKMLPTSMTGVSERHHEMTQVFDFTWSLLHEVEQTTFAKLTVFQRGFTFEASQEIANASAEIIMHLVNHSLIQREVASDRFVIHELLRQYGMQKLEDIGETFNTELEHLRYFADFIQQQEDDLIRETQLLAIRRLTPDFDNIKRAWYFALNNLTSIELSILDSMVMGLFYFIRLREYWQEGYTLFHQAVQMIHGSEFEDQINRFGFILVAYCNCMFFLNHIDKTVAYAKIGLIHAENHSDADAQIVLASSLSIFLQIFGQVDEARAVFENGLRVAEDYGNPYYFAQLYQSQAFVARLDNDPERVMKCVELSLPVFREYGDHYFASHSLSAFAYAVAYQGHYDEAISYLEESLAIHSDFGSEQSLIGFYVDLSYYAFVMGDLERTEAYNTKTVDLARRYNHLSYLQAGIGIQCQIALAHGTWDKAYQIALEVDALNNSTISFSEIDFGPTHAGFALWGKAQYQMASIQLVKNMHLCLFNSAPSFRVFALILSLPLLIREHQFERAVRLIAFLADQYRPNVFPRWYLIDHAFWTPLIQQLKLSLGNEHFQMIWEQGTSFDVEAEAHALLDEFSNI